MLASPPCRGPNILNLIGPGILPDLAFRLARGHHVLVAFQGSCEGRGRKANLGKCDQSNALKHSGVTTVNEVANSPFVILLSLPQINLQVVSSGMDVSAS
jgi:hypothetical protein